MTNELKIKVVGALDSEATKETLQKDISKLKIKKKDSKVNLIGTLNAGLSIKEINTAIRGIEKKVNPIKLKIDVDDRMLKSITAFQKQMKSLQEQAEKVNKVVSEITHPDGSKIKITTNNGVVDKTIVTEMEKINQSNKKIQQSSKLAGDAISTQKTAIERLRREFEKLDSTTKNYDKTNKLLGSTLKVTSANGARKLSASLDSDGNVKGFSIKTDRAKQERDAQDFIKQQEKMKQKVIELQQSTLYSSKTIERLNKMIDMSKNNAELDKAIHRMKQLENASKSVKVANDANNYVANAQIRADNLRSTHSGTVDNASLDAWLASAQRVNPQMTNMRQQMRELDQEFRRINGSAQEAARSSMTFGSMLQQALTKFPIWMLSATIFYAPIRALESMSARLIEIDTLMTDLKRIMDMPAHGFEDMLMNSVALSDELSSKLTDILAIMGEFGRMGFEDADLLGMAETAQILTNISDLTANESVDALTSAMLNFNIAAEDSMSIVDSLNEVN